MGLRVSELRRRFPGADTDAVGGISFDVRPGELLALVGASGSGKTTTLRLIAGYELPDAGTVSLLREDGTAREITMEPPQRRGFGMVFQHYALFPHMTVGENVAFGLEARGIKKAQRMARAIEALGRVGLGEASSRAVQSLSGGEQQRVALARALVIEPPVLLLDEPLSNLDPTLRQSTREQLRRMLLDLEVTAVFVTHDQEDAFAVADRVAMLHKGRLAQLGTPEGLYHAPATADVARFVGRGSLVPARVSGGRVTIPIAGVSQVADSATDWSDRIGHAMIRPEMLAIVEPGPTVWGGTVIDRRFAGGHFAYTVQLLDDLQLEVTTADGSAREGANVGLRLVAPRIALVPA